MEERRRSSDRELGDLAASYRGLIREIELDRKQRDEQHAENKRDGEERARKLDLVLGLKPLVDEHGRWIETEGKPTAKIVREGLAEVKGGVRGAKLGLLVGTSAVGGGIVAKLITLITAAFSHG